MQRLARGMLLLALLRYRWRPALAHMLVRWRELLARNERFGRLEEITLEARRRHIDHGSGRCGVAAVRKGHCAFRILLCCSQVAGEHSGQAQKGRLGALAIQAEYAEGREHVIDGYQVIYRKQFGFHGTAHRCETLQRPARRLPENERRARKWPRKSSYSLNKVSSKCGANIIIRDIGCRSAPAFGRRLERRRRSNEPPGGSRTEGRRHAYAPRLGRWLGTVPRALPASTATAVERGRKASWLGLGMA